MISRTALYRKSAKGTEAIAMRQHGLGPRQRSTLILIDGKRGFDELAKLGGMLGDANQLLDQLLDQLLADGFIEEVAGPAQPAAAAPTVAAAAPAVSLLEAQRFAVRRLTDLLGPNAEQLCLRIESARTTGDFNAALVRAEAALRDFGGAPLAEKFLAAIETHRPAT